MMTNTIIDNLKTALSTLDTTKGDLFRADLRIYADGSGFVEIWNDGGLNLEFHESFECTRGMNHAVENYVSTPEHVREGNAIAELLKCDANSPDLKNDLWFHLEHLMDAADMADPETIRRVYPLLVEIADMRGGIAAH